MNGEFLDACTAAAELALSLGQPERILARLQLAATMAPLHEPVHASLITALGAAGQQAEALSVFRAVRPASPRISASIRAPRWKPRTVAC